MRSALGDPPLSGENVSASAGAATASEVRAAAAAANRLIVRVERKAGGTIRGRRLGPCEGRIAFFDESGHAFAHVICAKKLMLDVGLELELRVEVAIDHAVDGALRSRVGLGRSTGQPLGQLERLLWQRLGLDDLVDQAPVERLLSRDALA